MRHLLGSLGGVLLTLVLLTLLALLVTPPVDDRPKIEEPLSMSMVEAPRQQSPNNAPAPAQAAPTPPAEAPPPPPPAPLPAPSPSSPVALPTPEVPAMEVPEVPLDAELPELTTQQPKPKAQPKPKPKAQPKPKPKPEPAPEPQASPERVAEADATHASEDSSQRSERDSAQGPASASGPVGSPQPTRKVPPEYPARAQRRGLEGYVEVRFTILPDGSVDSDSLRVTDAEPRNVFERAAMRAISRWQFPESASPREARQRLVFRLKG
ncbi:TonB family protein [Halomonas sp. HP20-15]|uniref:energy transducer TonB n=1 Tax=Halomonas sp. HP20-15 TaxID=3085901 RepID=UPI0029823C77|nr:TonB family protein [Halomonas sp. HP20-15]MDW5375752.1 TonB family protein [Halomonas sp. HP20-15]